MFVFFNNSFIETRPVPRNSPFKGYNSVFSADWRSWASALLSVCGVGFFSGGGLRAIVLSLDRATTRRRFGFALSHGGRPRACGRCSGRSPPPPAARLLPPSEAAPRPGTAPPWTWARLASEGLAVHTREAPAVGLRARCARTPAAFGSPSSPNSLSCRPVLDGRKGLCFLNSLLGRHR